MSTHKVKPDPDALERQHTHQRHRSVGKKLTVRRKYRVHAKRRFSSKAIASGYSRNPAASRLPSSCCRCRRVRTASS
jgi:hypothetical protein